MEPFSRHARCSSKWGDLRTSGALRDIWRKSHSPFMTGPPVGKAASEKGTDGVGGGTKGSQDWSVLVTPASGVKGT